MYLLVIRDGGYSSLNTEAEMNEGRLSMLKLLIFFFFFCFLSFSFFSSSSTNLFSGTHE